MTDCDHALCESASQLCSMCVYMCDCVSVTDCDHGSCRCCSELFSMCVCMCDRLRPCFVRVMHHEQVRVM